MLKVIAVLVLSTTINVAVETDTGWIERSFPNSTQGAEDLVGFAETSVGNAPDGVRVLLGSLNDDDNQSHIQEKFESIGLKFGHVQPDDVKSAAAKHHIAKESAVAVAKADEARFGFLYLGKPKQ